LTARLREVPGVEVEDKSISLAVHYRAASDKRRARQAIEQAVGQLEKCRVVAGIDVFNLVPHEAQDKGRALLRLLEESGCTSAVYIGDDVTDEDVFALEAEADPERLLGIRVGREGETRARWYVPGQKDIDDLLRLLLSAAGAGAGTK
jgi:trehalose 6-phosphate phosphatase